MGKELGLGFEIVTELSLGIPGSCSSVEKADKKRVFSETIEDENEENISIISDRKNQNKTQIVGWPPVCSYRRKTNNNIVVQMKNESDLTKIYIKVSMDGAAYLRKIDLDLYEGYSDLARAFEKLFGGVCNGTENSEYVPIYEDKDGDWMLVGDVPWTMFTESCKRLRIMKRSDMAKGFGLQTEKYESKGFNLK